MKKKLNVNTIKEYDGPYFVRWGGKTKSRGTPKAAPKGDRRQGSVFGFADTDCNQMVAVRTKFSP